MLEIIASVSTVTTIAYFDKPFTQTYSSSVPVPLPPFISEPGSLEPAPTNIQKFFGDDTTQAWFWSDDWQRGEEEAQADIVAGRGDFYGNADAFLESL